jgi:hypothetical protein
MKVIVAVVLAVTVLAFSDVKPVVADVALIDGPGTKDFGNKPKLRQQQRGTSARGGGPGFVPLATGSQALIDNSGVKYFINTNITFSTSSSASGAMSEASYTHAVAASTLNGGTVASTLNDAYDGYNTLCLSLNNTVATCQTGNANFVIYNKNGPPTTECLGRQIVFPVQTSGNVKMQRKVFVPSNDAFARWLNIFTNTGGSALTITPVIANNLGSDSNTVIVSSTNGNAAAETTDTWVTTFQNFSGTTSSDPRLGHVFGGAGAPVPLAGVHFANGDDNPFWGYTFTLQPSQTLIIANFAVVQPTKTAANSKSAELANFPINAQQCLSTTERSEIVNFALAPNTAQVPTMSQTAVVVTVVILLAIGIRRLRFA